MELLCQLDCRATADFFTTFFKLPSTYWRGFLASKLSSGGLACVLRSVFLLAQTHLLSSLRRAALPACSCGFASIGVPARRPARESESGGRARGLCLFAP